MWGWGRDHAGGDVASADDADTFSGTEAAPVFARYTS
eukprot:gene3597-14477_t